MSTHGQSEATIDKERRLGSALTIGMRVAAAKFSRHGFRYFHFDANAGSGWNDLFDVPGSPAVFWSLASQYLADMRTYGFFAELDHDRAQQLVAAAPENYAKNTFIFARDNEQVLEVFIEFIRQSGERPEFAVGSIICDPNGWLYRNARGHGAPIMGLRRLSIVCPRIDIILNLNARTYRLQKASGHHVDSPRAVLQSLNKLHWLVSRTHRGRDEFLLAVGRNFPTGPHAALGMHPLDSDQGRHVLTLVEGQRQRGLFDVA